MGGRCSLVFFFKQKTAYEMRISDWSSDVCSSDLIDRLLVVAIDVPRPDQIVLPAREGADQRDSFACLGQGQQVVLVLEQDDRALRRLPRYLEMVGGAHALLFAAGLAAAIAVVAQPKPGLEFAHEAHPRTDPPARHPRPAAPLVGQERP